jgi:hypothetical protein
LLQCRDAVVAGDNREYWELIQAKMQSLQEQPGSSQQAQDIGDALNVLSSLLSDNEDLFEEDRVGDAA